MRFYKNFLLLILEMLISIQFTNAQNNKWTLAKNKNGITVLTHLSKDSSNIEFLATMTVQASITDIYTIIDNVAEYKNWIANLKNAKTLKKINNHERYDYYLTYLPWPFENRDIIYDQTIIKKDNGTFIISFKSIPDYIPKKEKITRIKNSTGYWKLIPTRQGKIKVIYQLSFDPEYNFPEWILKMFIVDGPYQTLLNLRNIN